MQIIEKWEKVRTSMFMYAKVDTQKASSEIKNKFLKNQIYQKF